MNEDYATKFRRPGSVFDVPNPIDDEVGPRLVPSRPLPRPIPFLVQSCSQPVELQTLFSERSHALYDALLAGVGTPASRASRNTVVRLIPNCLAIPPSSAFQAVGFLTVLTQIQTLDFILFRDAQTNGGVRHLENDDCSHGGQHPGYQRA